MRSHVSGLLVQVLAALAALSGVACRTDPEWENWGGGAEEPAEGEPNDGSGGSRASGSGGTRAGGTGGDTSSGAIGGTGGTVGTGAAGSARGGSSAQSEGDAGDDGAAGAGEVGNEPQPVACDGQAVTWEELRSGQVRLGANVTIEGTATSQKFLLNHAQSGSCLWGAFVGAEPVAGEPRGVLVASYGEPAPKDQACPTGTDALPDALVVGDVLSVVGRFSTFAPTNCEGTVVPGPQLMVDKACALEPLRRVAPPEAVTLSLEVADAMARGADAALIRRYAGGLVRLEGVSGVRADDGEGVVAPYGVVRFAETRLEAHNDVEYGGLGGAGPKDPSRALAFPYPSEFTAVTGLVHLDFCAWSLAPRDRCRDFAPPSRNCSR